MSVDLSGLGNPDLRRVPLPFIRDSLVNLAPRLLAGADAITPLEYPSTDPSKPPSPTQPHFSCSFDPPTHLPASYCIPPTHLLGVSFPSTTSARPQPQQVLVPIHALPWGLACSRLRPLLRRQESMAAARPCEATDALCDDPVDPNDATTSLLTPPATPQTATTPLVPCPPAPSPDISSTLSLPLIRLCLPSPSAFQLLHTYIYTRTLPSPSLFPSSLHPRSRAEAVEALWKTCVELGIEPGEGEDLWCALSEEGRVAKEALAAEKEEEKGEWASGESDEEEESDF
ncbi:hypothetical protein JCM10295v2_007046 [Rhodotorula toruloides]